MLRDLAIPESKQRIFQSDAAALEEVQRIGGVTLANRFPPSAKTSLRGGLMHIKGPELQAPGEWCALTLTPAATSTGRLGVDPIQSPLPRLHTQAMIRGTGVGVHPAFGPRSTSRSGVSRALPAGQRPASSARIRLAASPTAPCAVRAR